MSIVSSRPAQEKLVKPYFKHRLNAKGLGAWLNLYSVQDPVALDLIPSVEKESDEF
jgi:hypothetical protein